MFAELKTILKSVVHNLPVVSRGLASAVVGTVLMLAGCAGSPAGAGAHRTSTPAAQPRQLSGRAAVSPSQWVVVGDVDGDGKPDRAGIVDLDRRSAADPGAAADPWAYRLVVQLSTGRTVGTEFAAEPPQPGPRIFRRYVVGGTDLGGSGSPEVFVQINQGASTTFVSPFRLVGQQLRRLTIGKVAAIFGAGGTVASLEGFGCAKPYVVSWEATERADHHSYAETITRYALRGWRLAQVSKRHKTLRSSAVGDIRYPCPGLPEALNRAV